MPKKFNKMYKFWIKTVVLYTNVHLVPKKQNNCTFYTKNEVFAKKFTKMYKVWIKTVVLYPKMYIWSGKPKELYSLH